MTRRSPRSFDECYVVDDAGCWLWTGVTSGNGYGQVKIKGRLHIAHRVSWERAHGPIPVGLSIDHLCRVRNCVNPDHLEPVTPAENSRRSPAVSKLTLKAAREIRAEHARGVNQRALADRYGVVPATISWVVRGHTWREESEAA